MLHSIIETEERQVTRKKQIIVPIVILAAGVLSFCDLFRNEKATRGKG